MHFHDFVASSFLRIVQHTFDVMLHVYIFMPFFGVLRQFCMQETRQPNAALYINHVDNRI